MLRRIIFILIGLAFGILGGLTPGAQSQDNGGNGTNGEIPILGNLPEHFKCYKLSRDKRKTDLKLKLNIRDKFLPAGKRDIVRLDIYNRGQKQFLCDPAAKAIAPEDPVPPVPNIPPYICYVTNTNRRPDSVVLTDENFGVKVTLKPGTPDGGGFSGNNAFVCDPLRFKANRDDFPNPVETFITGVPPLKCYTVSDTPIAAKRVNTEDQFEEAVHSLARIVIFCETITKLVVENRDDERMELDPPPLKEQGLICYDLRKKRTDREEKDREKNGPRVAFQDQFDVGAATVLFPEFFCNRAENMIAED